MSKRNLPVILTPLIRYKYVNTSKSTKIKLIGDKKISPKTRVYLIPLILHEKICSECFSIGDLWFNKCRACILKSL
jgi:hypothetical protein